MASKDLAPITAGDESPFAVLKMDPSDLRDLLMENIGGDSLGERDLDRVRVPSGAGSRWELPTIEGTEAVTTIEGVIVHRANRRAYWPTSYDDAPGEQPQCFSNDGQIGVGDPGGACIECPYNEFGSDAKGVAKACKEMRQLFVLTADSLIPIVVTIPPGSLANTKAYFLRLLRTQVSPLEVVTSLGLEKTSNKAGTAFSRVTFSAGARLDPEAVTRLKAYAAALQPSFEAAARVDRSEAEAADE